MRRRRLLQSLSLLGVALGLSIPASLPAALYDITALNVLPSGVESRAFGVNEQGQVAGDSRFDHSGHIGQSRPVIWDSAGTPTELWNDPLVGGSAADINNSGMVVGRYGSGSGIPLPGPGVPFGRGFVWDSINGRHDLGLEPVGNTQAVAVNDSGQVVGTSEVLMNIGGSDFFVPRAFVWSETNGIQDIGTLGGNFSFANALNSSGQVTGYSETASGNERAFVWNVGMGMQEIISPTGTSSRAWGINDEGIVVGVERNDFAMLPPNAFIWMDGAGVTLLGFPAGTSSVAFDINSRREVVGQFTSLAGEQGAFIWTQTSGALDLETLIPPGSGWNLESALSINDFGFIVGFGHLNGTTRAFLLTPVPEPPAALLAMLTITAAAFSNRSRTF